MVSRLNPDSAEIKPRSGPTIFDSWMDAPSDSMGAKDPTSSWLVVLVQFVGLSDPPSSSLSFQLTDADVQ